MDPFSSLKDCSGRAIVVSLASTWAPTSGLVSRLEILVKVLKDPYLLNPRRDYFDTYTVVWGVVGWSEGAG